jgi:hypothetical protein
VWISEPLQYSRRRFQAPFFVPGSRGPISKKLSGVKRLRTVDGVCFISAAFELRSYLKIDRFLWLIKKAPLARTKIKFSESLKG